MSASFSEVIQGTHLSTSLLKNLYFQFFWVQPLFDWTYIQWLTEGSLNDLRVKKYENSPQMLIYSHNK